MSTLNVTFAFLSDAQGFSSSAGAASTLTWDGTTGNPAGSLRSVLAGSNKNNNNSWTRTLTYETMGVPAGSTITGITSASLDSRCTAFTSGTGCTSGAATLVDGVTTVTLSAQRSFSATDGAFVTTAGTDLTGLTKASSNSVVLTIPNHLGTTSGGSGKGVTLHQDQLKYTLTYTTAFNVVATGGSFALAGGVATLRVGLGIGSGSFAATGGAATLSIACPTTGGAFALTGGTATLTNANTTPGLYWDGAYWSSEYWGNAYWGTATTPVTPTTADYWGNAYWSPEYWGDPYWGMPPVVVGSLHGDGGSFALTGSNSTFELAFPVDELSFVPTGGPATLDVIIGVAAGSFATTGTAATPGLTFAIDTGTLALTGGIATLIEGSFVPGPYWPEVYWGTPYWGDAYWGTGFGPIITFDTAGGSFTLTGVTTILQVALGVTAGTFSLAAGTVLLATGKALIGASGSFSLTGTATTLGFKLPGATGSFALTGGVATPQVSLGAAAGSFATTGTAATLGLKLPGAPGSFALTGSGSTSILNFGPVLTADIGTFTLTAGAATLKVLVSAESAGYTLNGRPAMLNAGLIAATGSFGLTGGPATLGLTAPLANGTFALTGNAATLRVGLGAAAGTFAVTGGAATLGSTLPAGAGSLALTGGAATLTLLVPISYTLPAGIGGVVLTGGPATLGTSLSAGTDSFALVGGNAALENSGSIAIAADSGSFVTIGGDGALNLDITIAAGSGPFLWVGGTAGLTPVLFVPTASPSHSPAWLGNRAAIVGNAIYGINVYDTYCYGFREDILPTQSVGWSEFFQSISDYLVTTNVFGPGSSFWAIDPDSVIQWPSGPPPFGLVVPRRMHIYGDDIGGGRFSKHWTVNLDIHIVVGNAFDPSFRDNAVVTSADLAVGSYALVQLLIDKLEQAFISTVNGNFATVEAPRAIDINELHRFKQTNAYVSIPVTFEMSVLQSLPSTWVTLATPPSPDEVAAFSDPLIEGVLFSQD